MTSSHFADFHTRELKFAPLNLEDVKQNGRFEGYASLFNTVDLAKDIVEPGAFRSSLKKAPLGRIKMLFQHDPAAPIGVWDKLVEDRKGLYVQGHLLNDVEQSRNVLSLMRNGALDGLSIGFKARKSRRDARTAIRHLIDIDLFEISVVTFPMHPDARVSTIKSKPTASGFPTIRDFERWLMRDAGFTRRQAQLAIAKGFKSLAVKRDAGGKAKHPRQLLNTLRKAAKKLQTK